MGCGSAPSRSPFRPPIDAKRLDRSRGASQVKILQFLALLVLFPFFFIYRLVIAINEIQWDQEVDPEKQWALALAYPTAALRVPDGFDAAMSIANPKDLEKTIRHATLHYFGLRSGMPEEELKVALSDLVCRCWFQNDLDALRPQDNPRDAMAFACARLAFAVRVAHLVGWVDEKTQWEVLRLNAQRAHECFESWCDFGEALVRGRQQWIARGRADSLGASFQESHVRRWVVDKTHPWCYLAWHRGAKEPLAPPAT